MNTDAFKSQSSITNKLSLKEGSPASYTLQSSSNVMDLSQEHGTDSTTLQTPSPLTRLKQDLVCKCGSTSFVQYKFRLNCRICGVFAVQSPEGFICGMNLKEDICPHGHALSAQERLESVKGRQRTTEVIERIYRPEALQMIQKGAVKFKMGNQTVQLAILYYDIVMAEHKDLKAQAMSLWQLTALTCLILACKFQERDDNVPLIQELIRCLVGSHSARIVVRSTAQPVNAITYEQVCSNELEIMARLGWDLFRVTPLHFVDNYCTQGLILTSDAISVALCDTEVQALESYRSGPSPDKKLSSTTTSPNQRQTVKVFRQPGRKTLQKVKRLARHLLDLAMEHNDMFNGLTPEVLAISTVICARRTCKLDESLRHIESLFQFQDIYNNPDINRCCKALHSLDDNQNSIVHDSSTHLINTETKPKQTVNLLQASSHRTGRAEYTAITASGGVKKDSQISMRLKQIANRRDSVTSAQSGHNNNGGNISKHSDSRSSIQQPTVLKNTAAHMQKSASGRSAANFVLNLKTLQKQTSAVNTSSHAPNNNSDQKPQIPKHRQSISKDPQQMQMKRPQSDLKSVAKIIQFRPQPKTSKNHQSLIESSCADLTSQSQSGKKPPLQQAQSSVYLDLSKVRSSVDQTGNNTRDKLFQLISSGQDTDNLNQLKPNFISKNINYISKLSQDKGKTQSILQNQSGIRYQSQERERVEGDLRPTTAQSTQAFQALSTTNKSTLTKFKVVLKQFQHQTNPQQKLTAMVSEYMPLTARSKQLQLNIQASQSGYNTQLKMPTQSSIGHSHATNNSITRQRSVPKKTEQQAPTMSVKLGMTKPHSKKMSIDHSSMQMPRSQMISKLVSPLASTKAGGRSTVLSSAHSSSTLQQNQQKQQYVTRSSKAYMPTGQPPSKQSSAFSSRTTASAIKMLQRPPAGGQQSKSSLQQILTTKPPPRRVSSFLGDFQSQTQHQQQHQHQTSGSAQVQQPHHSTSFKTIAGVNHDHQKQVPHE